ncbi:MAG: lysophospholipid acyltransferase family protein [gamma proteobacterium endosymbiont of Lamellibrachia anaximandri]|nr:lysophospholipid acyltransferase family protein [gamma proteobacterium endosymbiont of Lamellibrachia anaximandri]
MGTKIIIALLRLLAILPLRRVHGLGRLLGRLFILLPNRERRNADINLQLCFPDLSETERLVLRNRSLEETGKVFAEMSPLWFWPKERVLGLVKEVSGMEYVKCEPGRGLIVLTPHLGSWEISGLYLATYGQLTTLYRPPRNQALELLITQARSRTGAELVPTTPNGIKRLYQTLKAGNIVGILPDQQPKSLKGAAFAPFFGVPALTILLVSRLARKSGASVVLGFAERLPKGEGYHIHIVPVPEGIDSPDPETAVAALNQGVEACVRISPEQYLWSYKRFDMQPDGKPSPYNQLRS